MMIPIHFPHFSGWLNHFEPRTVCFSMEGQDPSGFGECGESCQELVDASKIRMTGW